MQLTFRLDQYGSRGVAGSRPDVTWAPALAQALTLAKAQGPKLALVSLAWAPESALALAVDRQQAEGLEQRAKVTATTLEATAPR